MSMGVLSIILFLFSIFTLYLFLPWVTGKVIRYRQKSKAMMQRKIYLTFDDGPGSRLTPEILARLKKNEIKATFFVLGKNISGREEIIKSIFMDGHAIASHSYSHLHAWKVMPWEVLADVRKGWKAIGDTLPVENTPCTFRPPYGKLNLFSLLFLWLHKVSIVFWSVDCMDTSEDFKRNIYHAAEMIKKDGGGIVLYHDFDRTTDHLDTDILDSLEAVIKMGQQMQLEFAVIGK